MKMYFWYFSLITVLTFGSQSSMYFKLSRVSSTYNIFKINQFSSIFPNVWNNQYLFYCAVCNEISEIVGSHITSECSPRIVYIQYNVYQILDLILELYQVLGVLGIYWIWCGLYVHLRLSRSLSLSLSLTLSQTENREVAAGTLAKLLNLGKWEE